VQLLLIRIYLLWNAKYFVLQAYKDRFNNEREKQLPLGNMTNEQFFFVAFAQVYMIFMIISVIVYDCSVQNV